MRCSLRFPLVTCLGLALAGCAPPINEPSDDAGPGFDVQERFSDWLSGAFDSSAQAAADLQYFAIQLVACPVDATEIGEQVLYVEQAVMDSPDQPYRQRLYLIEGDAVEPLVATSEVFLLDAPEEVVGICDLDPDERPAFSDADAALKESCGVRTTWEEDEAMFVGGTVGEGCESTRDGASYATAEVEVSADLMTSWDRGFDADGDQVWGATAGPYEFLRR